ncbi:hypothetical protein EJB05_48667, partial [Eragrostis curvula]
MEVLMWSSLQPIAFPETSEKDDIMDITADLDSEKTRSTAVSSVEEALNFLDAENDVNLILADYFTDGGMRGYDLLTKVKESSKLKHIPMVITCTEDDPDLIKKCMEGGAKGFFLTPLKFEDVPTLLSFI